MDSHNILLLDNEVSNLNALKRTLRREYNVFLATNEEGALAIIERNDIALIIAANNIPGMNSIEFLERNSQRYPDTIRIILAAYDEKLIMDAVNMEYVDSYITKPWEPEEVKNIVSEKLASASQMYRERKKMIGEILLGYDIISENQLEEALELQKHEKGKLGEILVHLGYADEQSIFSCYALQLGMPYISLSQFSSKPEVAELLPPKLAHRYGIVAVDLVGLVLVVATSEPLSDKARSEIEEETGHKAMFVCASHGDIETVLEENYAAEPMP